MPEQFHKLQELFIHHVASLAKRLGKHIAVYDLETTDFRGTPHFGITEMFCIIVAPDGKYSAIGSLVNPEAPISKKASEITGITQDMVDSEKNWGELYAQMFYNIAAGECWAVGFNNQRFDNLAVQDANAKYGLPIPVFAYTFDVYKLHLTMSKAVTQKGNLLTVAKRYEVDPRGDLHRAKADTVLTVETLNAMIAHYGVEQIAQVLEKNCVASTSAKPIVAKAGVNAPKPDNTTDKGAPKRTLVPKEKPLMQALIKFVDDKSFVDLPLLEDALQSDAKALSFQIGKAIDERLVDPRKFAKSEAQHWIYPKLIELDFDVLTQGKLKPIHDALVPNAPPGVLDYIQLRIALLDFGMSWATLKPANA